MDWEQQLGPYWRTGPEGPEEEEPEVPDASDGERRLGGKVVVISQKMGERRGKQER